MITLRQTFIVSLGLHCAVFIFSAIRWTSQHHITLPIEVTFYSPPQPAPAHAAVVEKIIEPPKKDEIAVSKKKHARTEKKVVAPSPAPAQPAAVTPPSDTPPAPASRISLDTKNFPYAYYTNMVVKKISRYWQWSTDFGSLKTVVYFKIDKDGVVTEAMVSDTSGDRLFDQQAVRAIKLSSPFPPLPQEFPEPDLGVYFEFSYH
ncbi:MAG: TonB family protein [Elusimicrobia bacterium]|nr:TonB family protein [Elusimicrobiota bacterium]